jgi:hypothetical protein
MPPMDTGIIKAHIRFSANETVKTAEQRIGPLLQWLHNRPDVVMSSVSFGSEPGVLSLGAGSLPTEAVMTIQVATATAYLHSPPIELQKQIGDQCTECGSCLKNCSFLTRYGTPQEYCRPFRLFSGREPGYRL